MKPLRSIDTHHDEVIHDVKYDFYGKRLATVSSDQRLKVWDLNDANEWELSAEWKAHSGSIWKVEWAHPEFGQVLATCSYDRTVCIWEEPQYNKKTKDGESETAAASRKKQGWTKRAALVDCRENVQDLKFAPRHLGLRLAACCSDGQVYIYEAADPMNLSSWSLTHSFEAGRRGANCVSWNPAPSDPAMIVVGCNWDEESYGQGAVQTSSSNNGPPAAVLRVWQYDESHRRWEPVNSLVLEHDGHTDSVYDVAWSPLMARQHHLIASASKDKTVRIWTLLRKRAEPPVTYRVSDTCYKLTDHNAEVWKVEWNILGTILASSGDDGNVRLWKANVDGNWENISNAVPQ